MSKKAKAVFGIASTLLLGAALSAEPESDSIVREDSVTPTINVQAPGLQPQSSQEKQTSEIVNAVERVDTDKKELDQESLDDSSVPENVTIVVPNNQTSQPVSVSIGSWYVSSHHSSKYYYHESCDGWQGLSEKYLKSFATEAELQANVPGRVLHYDCVPKY